MATWEEWFQTAADKALDVYQADKTADANMKALELQARAQNGTLYTEGRPIGSAIGAGLTANQKTGLMVGAVVVVGLLLLRGN
ncbi:hypothetical protein [Aquabacterium sp.]|uniref:hypothetical protein n=1 Tax=Aquabacterium sp. TaxID=1872578 RepID=UPI0025BC2CEF|nr:hypothetical protein [Aquabacterium sp.]